MYLGHDKRGLTVGSGPRMPGLITLASQFLHEWGCGKARSGIVISRDGQWKDPIPKGPWVPDFLF